MKKNVAIIVLSLYSVLTSSMIIKAAFQIVNYKEALAERDEIIIDLRDKFAEQEPTQIASQLTACQNELRQARNVVALNENDNSQQPTTEETQEQVSQEDFSVPLREWRSYREQYRDNKENMTDLQFKTWWEQFRDEVESKYKGRRITTSGYVYEASEGIFDGLTVRLDIDDDRSFSVSEMTLDLTNDQKQAALQLQQGQQLTFTGTLDYFNFALGSMSLKFKDVTW